MNVVTAFCVRLMAAMYGNLVVEILLVVVCADMVFGSMRAAKERCWNSSVGIDGAIRKAGMVASIVLFSLMDMILRVDLFAWLPVNARDALNAVGIVKAGCTELFGLLYILYEAVSVLKNMLLCGLPVPAGVREKLGGWLNEMTDETNAQLTVEGHHTMMPVRFEEAQLAEMDEDTLRNMALEMGLSFDASASKEDLIQLLCAETVYV